MQKSARSISAHELQKEPEDYRPLRKAEATAYNLDDPKVQEHFLRFHLHVKSERCERVFKDGFFLYNVTAFESDEEMLKARDQNELPGWGAKLESRRQYESIALMVNAMLDNIYKTGQWPRLRALIAR